MMPARTRAGVFAALLAALSGGWYLRDKAPASAPPVPEPGGLGAAGTEDAAEKAFLNRASGVQLLVTGTVDRILADDRDGSPHQRFILRSPGGLTLLIAHNLDLAPRLTGLRKGEEVTVFGEYEWSEKGGVMHWTHDDPQGRHLTGYIEWRGRRYQ